MRLIYTEIVARLIPSFMVLLMLVAPVAGEAAAIAAATPDAPAASCCCGKKTSCKCGCDPSQSPAPDTKPVSIRFCPCKTPAIPTSTTPTTFPSYRLGDELTVVPPFFTPGEAVTPLPQVITYGSSGPPELIASLASVILLI